MFLEHDAGLVVRHGATIGRQRECDDRSLRVRQPYVTGANTATFTAVGTGPGNSPFRRGDAFEVTWYVQYECMVNGQRVGCQLVDYTYRYVNQANGNPNWQPVPGTPFVSSPQACAP